MIFRLPFRQSCNEILQTYCTKSLNFNREVFEAKVRHSQIHINNFRRYFPNHSNQFRSLEIGTGWFPVLPLALFLAGSAVTWTFDAAPLLTDARILKTVRFFVEYAKNGSLRNILPAALNDKVLQLCEVYQTHYTSPRDILTKLNIYPSICGLRKAGLEYGSFDLIVSTGVLEYIKQKELIIILSELRWLSSVKAVMSHGIGLGDDYAAFDKTILPLNFLKFSSKEWRYLSNPFALHNRMRISEYRKLLCQSGFMLVNEEIVNGSLADLQKLRLAPEFQKFSTEDLLAIDSMIVATVSLK